MKTSSLNGCSLPDLLWAKRKTIGRGEGLALDQLMKAAFETPQRRFGESATAVIGFNLC